MLTHGNNNAAELVTLSLSASMTTDALLQELQRSLVSAVLQQFHGSSLIRRKSSDFTNKITDGLNKNKVIAMHRQKTAILT